MYMNRDIQKFKQWKKQCLNQYQFMNASDLSIWLLLKNMETNTGKKEIKTRA